MTAQSQPAQGSGDASAVNCAIEHSQVGTVYLITVSGTLDMLTAPKLEEAVAAATSSGAQAVVVDLSAVDFLASAGMGVLVAAHAELRPAVRLVIVADGPATSRPLQLVGIADVIELFATVDEALAAVTS
jgi:anti-sigma B factor antagonist